MPKNLDRVGMYKICLAMKKLDFIQMVSCKGGKLTQQEIDDFLGAASCTLILIKPSIFGVLGCWNWISNM
jgi:hypothetical protein